MKLCLSSGCWSFDLPVRIRGIILKSETSLCLFSFCMFYSSRHCQPQFTARLRDKYADMTFSKDHVTVKCTLRQSMPNYRTLVRGWETGVQEAVAKFLAGNIDQADIGVPEQIWDKLMEFLNSGTRISF